jgi:hypothetical protein
VGATEGTNGLSAHAFTIDYDVPLPPKKGRRPKDEWIIWPFADMRVGASFFAGLNHGARTAAQDFEAFHPGTKFATRAYDDTNPDPKTKLPGIRIWRIQ